MKRRCKSADGTPAQVTANIVAAIEGGVGTWLLPWHSTTTPRAPPRTILSGKRYRGVNTVALWVAGAAQGFTSAEWGTELQWATRDTRVGPGERPTFVLAYREAKRDSGTGAAAVIRVARAFPVFNADQTFSDRKRTQGANKHHRRQRFKLATELIAATNAKIKYGAKSAFYLPTDDQIQIPAVQQFRGWPSCSAREAFYATLFHELGHWTGSDKRLARDLSGQFGDELYAFEELVAELTSAFLCADLGICCAPRPDHAQYVGSWLGVLRRSPRSIARAASAAERARTYLLSMRRTGFSRARPQPKCQSGI